MSERMFFRADDIARMWTEERRRARGPGEPEVSVLTVYRYVQRSRNGIYQNNPMPMPIYPASPDSDEHTPRPGQIPLWVPDQGESMTRLEQRIRAWWHSRRGSGTGGGRPWPSIQGSNPVTPGTTRDAGAARGETPPVEGPE